MREPYLRKGLHTCDASQVTPKVGDENSAGRNSVNNAWYVNTSNGNRNNNNTYNRYNVVGASEFIKDGREWVTAEAAAYKNEHHNFRAARIHYHLPELYAFVEDMHANGYKPRQMTTFVLSYPVFRKAFAPDEFDCVVDHFCAPLFNAVAEGMHMSNGDISHGNRIGHSAQGMAECVRRDIDIIESRYPHTCVRAHIDIEGFFMHIRRQMAYDILEKYSEFYYPYPDREEKLALLKTTLLNDPTKDCLFKSPRSAWGHIADNKTLFRAERGCGLPIGKFPSQVVAGIVLAVAESALAGLGLKVHKNKRSIQPAHRGMLSCGRVVKGGRIYIGNRTVHACRSRIEGFEKSVSGAAELRQSVNSVFGLMKHCSAFRIQETLGKEVLDGYGRWLYFRAKPNQFVCVLKKRFTPKERARREMLSILGRYGKTRRQLINKNVIPC